MNKNALITHLYSWYNDKRSNRPMDELAIYMIW